MRLSSLVLLIGLAGCVTAQERAEQQAAQVAQMKAKWAAEDDVKCSQWFGKGTPDYGKCRLAEDTNRRTAIAGYAAATDAANTQAAAIRAASDDQPRPTPAPTTCTTGVVFGTLTTTCR
jgi:hypothetical protein